MDATATRPAISGIDITAYSVLDAERAKRFYGETLGLTATTDYGPQGAEYELADGSTFGVWQVPASNWSPCSGVMFAVPDVRAAVAYYRERGVAFTAFDGTNEVGEFPHCLMALAKDSEGNSLILHQRT